MHVVVDELTQCGPVLTIETVDVTAIAITEFLLVHGRCPFAVATEALAN
jgi:hypothetical protein